MRPIFKPPKDPTDITSFPTATPLCPWHPMSETPPRPYLAYGVFLPTGEATNATWIDGRWFNFYGEVYPLAWSELPKYPTT